MGAVWGERYAAKGGVVRTYDSLAGRCVLMERDQLDLTSALSRQDEEIISEAAQGIWIGRCVVKRVHAVRDPP
jgi:hypothetical protein